MHFFESGLLLNQVTPEACGLQKPLTNISSVPRRFPKLIPVANRTERTMLIRDSRHCQDFLWWSTAENRSNFDEFLACLMMSRTAIINSFTLVIHTATVTLLLPSPMVPRPSESPDSIIFFSPAQQVTRQLHFSFHLNRIICNDIYFCILSVGHGPFSPQIHQFEVLLP